ncbi:MAG: SNF2-related protein, partial [Firmicutes bacterium]|nr:SNF2-related protein [Bacillota bacterium]
EFVLLFKALKGWQEEAQKFLLTQSQQQLATLAVRVSRIREGRGIQVTVGEGENHDLLASLNHVLRDWSVSFAPWMRALSDGSIVPVVLNENETDQFWEYELPRLMSLGVSVEFPRGWSHVALTAMGHPDGVANLVSFSPEQLAQVNWDIALDNRQLSMDDLEKLAKTKESVVHVGTEWIVADTDLVERARRMYEKVRHQKMTLGRMLRYAIEEGPDDIQFRPPEQLAQAIESLKQPAAAIAEIPRFIGKLRSYQAYAVGWLQARLQVGVGVLLADDMGLGKTIEIIATLLYWWEEHPQDKPVLIICPLSVIRNWQQEWEHFSENVTVGCHVGSQRVSGGDWAPWAQQFDVVLTTYDVLARDHQFMKNVQWAGIV